MNESGSLGGYLRKKRLEAGLTQKELAGRLYVTESAVSKWERDLSCPDASIVPAICRELGISEREFFAACGNERPRTEDRETGRRRNALAVLRRVFAVGYATAVVACLICNLAVFHTLDWFWIVLASVMLAFSLTNLPALAVRNRLPVSLGAATGSLLLLLAACWAYTGDWGPMAAAVITAACLALPWSWWVIWRFYGKHVAPLCMAAFSVWVFVLLLSIWSVTFGQWHTLVCFAYPIAAFSVGYVWLGFAALYWLPAGTWMKAAVLSLLTTFAVPLGNTLSAFLLPGQHTPVLLDYLAWWHIFTHESVNGFSWINVLVFYILLTVSAALLAVGAAAERRRRPK